MRGYIGVFIGVKGIYRGMCGNGFGPIDKDQREDVINQITIDS